jgi:hypothetical protein
MHGRPCMSRLCKASTRVQMFATASLPPTARPHLNDQFMPPYLHNPERTKVALGTPLHARHPGDFRKDSYMSCMLEQALAATGHKQLAPMRIQVLIAPLYL